MQQVARGLWRWTAPHPDWEPSPKKGSPADWPQLVGSVAYETEGVETIQIRNAGERMIWIREHGALVPGDRLLGAARGGLRGCPDSWLGYLGDRTSPARLRKELQKLLELPVRMVLVSHGEPVLRDAKRKLARAVA
jgi:hypothetical protein